MKVTLWGIGAIVVLVGAFYLFNGYIYKEKQGDTTMQQATVEVIPIMHASLALKWGEKIVYADPTGSSDLYARIGKADLIVVTHDHGDHLSTSMLTALMQPQTVLVTSQAIAERLPESLKEHVVVLRNGDVTQQIGLSIQAIPAYNLRPEDLNKHPRGHGNGYVLEGGENRVYIAGDTEDIPEMRALQDIDIAFVPMNLPYTMNVEKAADAVLAFIPKQVYPYHYRTPEGFSDVEEFKRLVNAGNPAIEVVLRDWYAH